MPIPAPISSLYSPSTPSLSTPPLRSTTIRNTTPATNTVSLKATPDHPQNKDVRQPSCVGGPNSDSTPSSSSSVSPSAATTSSHFSDLIGSAELPPPGPSYYAARRTLWLDPPREQPTPPSPSTSRTKLEALLSQQGAVESEEVWKAGLKNVWMGLVGGNQLRKRLPLSIVIRILQAGWMRDGTWPPGGVAPEDDTSLDAPISSSSAVPPPSTTELTEVSPLALNKVDQEHDVDLGEGIDIDDPDDGRHEGG